MIACFSHVENFPVATRVIVRSVISEAKNSFSANSLVKFAMIHYLYSSNITTEKREKYINIPTYKYLFIVSVY